MDKQDPAIRVNQITKTYATVRAVDKISFDVHYGEIFGLLGPNGAGKTTAIRMILDIIRPDSGEVSIFGEPMDASKKDLIGYLPEERGLYEDMKLIDILVFLARLKGIERREAEERAKKALQDMDLWEARERKVTGLSRGMNQKAQFIAATIHEPKLIIVDEPFSGLDPVNTRVIKGLLYKMRDRGAAVIMSTHQMNQVEEMCERIMVINHGKQVLYGPLSDVRQQFAPNAVEVAVKGEIHQVDGVDRITKSNGKYRLVLQEGARPEVVLKELVDQPRITVQSFEQVQTSLEEIFVRVVGHTVQEEGITK
jgi:ABC-2 type transport system ATP-binding protein